MKYLYAMVGLFTSFSSFAAAITVFPLGENPSCPIEISKSLVKMASELKCRQNFSNQKIVVYLGCGSTDAHNFAHIEIYSDNTNELLAMASTRALKAFSTPQRISKKMLIQSLCE